MQYQPDGCHTWAFATPKRLAQLGVCHTRRLPHLGICHTWEFATARWLPHLGVCHTWVGNTHGQIPHLSKCLSGSHTRSVLNLERCHTKVINTPKQLPHLGGTWWINSKSSQVMPWPQSSLDKPGPVAWVKSGPEGCLRQVQPWGIWDKYFSEVIRNKSGPEVF